MLNVPEKFRITFGRMASSPSNGNNGAFMVRIDHGQLLHVICSDGMGWEHVSVSREDRTPTWEEMCQIKEMFWDDEDCVIQFHPRRSEYVNNHKHCLHMWRPINQEIPIPPSVTVGIKGLIL